MSYHIRNGLRAKTGQGNGKDLPSHFVRLTNTDDHEQISEELSIEHVLDEFRRLFTSDTLKDQPPVKTYLGYVASFHAVEVDYNHCGYHAAIRPDADKRFPDLGDDDFGQFVEVLGLQMTICELANFADYVLTNVPVHDTTDLRLEWIREVQATLPAAP